MARTGTSFKAEPPKIVLNMSIFDDDDKRSHDMESSYIDAESGIGRSRYRPSIGKFLKKSAKKMIPIYEIPDNMPSTSEDEPSFTGVMAAIMLTFWFFFVFQMIAFILIVLAYIETQKKDFKKARKYIRMAWLMLALGLAMPLVIWLRWYFMYSLPFEYSSDAIYDKPCDPGCFYLELRKRCLC